MPEGDTIFRTARTLDRAIGGQALVGFRSTVPRWHAVDLTGRRVEEVESRGKNLLIHLDDGRAIYSHMRMRGSWHVYRPGERWKTSAPARLVLETETFVAVCFEAPVIELLTARQIDTHPMLENLGPDLIDVDVDLDEVLRRLRDWPDLEIGEAIMNQQIAAGVGNIYKSETLFICRVSPFVCVREVDDARALRVFETAARLLRRNLSGRRRRTRNALNGQDHWVYLRSQKPCHECDTPIEVRTQGREPRSTYFCPACQRSD